MSETLHHLPSQVGVLVGKESTHGTRASSMDIIAGRSVVFAESVNENKVEIYDPANGQALQEMVQGTLDVGGTLSFSLVDWRWLYWIMGTHLLYGIELETEVGAFAAADTLSFNGGATATVTSRPSGDLLELESITGTIVQGETFNDGGAKTGVVKAIVHDISLGTKPISLTVENIFNELSESEEFYGMRGNEASSVSTRGEVVPVDMNLVGLDEDTNSSPDSRAASTKTPWIWSTGSILLNSVNLDNVCDTISIKIMRNAVARGGHNRIAHEVVAGNFKVELTFDMDLPSSAVRILRRANTKVSLALSYINVALQQQAVLTLSNLQILSDVRDTTPDAETVRVSVVANTGSLTARIYDDIFDY